VRRTADPPSITERKAKTTATAEAKAEAKAKAGQMQKQDKCKSKTNAKANAGVLRFAQNDRQRREAKSNGVGIDRFKVAGGC
jgi:hypothetical protein